jgi:hypothetical protein
MIFGVVTATLGAASLPAQEVPGRDLLLFPIGSLAEPQALATTAGTSFWNPASGVLDDSSRARGTVAALSTPADQGVSLQLLDVAARLPAGVTASLSAVHGTVDGLIRTTDSPLDGSEVPYGTWVLSAGVSRRQDRVTVGLAARHRTGRVDGLRRGSLGLDAGVIAVGLLGIDARLAASSFLWRPASSSEERTTYSLAADARAWGADEHHQVRAGYAYGLTESVAREHYLFASGRWDAIEARAGVAEARTFGTETHRLRLGVGLHRARYLVGIAREDGGAGLDAIYQFTLSATLP